MDWNAVIGGVVRHLLTVAGGWMVAQGYADEATTQAIVGGAVAAIGVAWSIWAKRA